MPIYDNDGTTNYQIGNLYDADDTTRYQIGKVYDNDGTANSLIYSASVTLTNLLGSASQTVTYAYSDHGALETYTLGAALPTVAGHRYYVRATVSAWVGGCSHGYSPSGSASAYFSGTSITSTSNSGGSTSATGHVIAQAGSATTYLQINTYRNGSDQGSMDATYSMVVDITELEASTGITFTADSFWAKIGSTVFYNTKEIDA